jgi:hypothetical protein
MAFALRITAKIKNGQEVEIEPAWWNINQLLRTHNFKEDSSEYYLDYYLYVNKQNFLNIIDSQEKYRKKEIYRDGFWILENNLRGSEFDHLVENLEEDSTIRIWIYEWESGLN